MGNSPQFRDRSAVSLGGDRADLLFEVLSHPYRRFVLWYLREADGRTSMEQLSREVEAWQSALTAPHRGVSGEATIELSLRHTHLPKLETADLVEYDSERVVLGDAVHDAMALLEEVVEA